MFNVVLIETQNTCTRKCAFCKFGVAADPDVVQLAMGTIDHIAQQLSDLKFNGRISPFGINEPLLDDRLFDIIRAFRVACPAAEISINTNGDLLTHRIHQRLFDVGLSALGISLYSESARQKMQQFLGDPLLPTIAIDMINPGPKLENRGGSVPGMDNAQQRHLPCHRPSNMLVIRPSGDVVLCCADMYSRVVMGNVEQQSLVEIWNADRFVRYRERLKLGQRSTLDLCRDCSHRGFTSSIFYPFPQRQRSFA
jgi:radical SAM protein with 4Fe4S-binding SPASM domain